MHEILEGKKASSSFLRIFSSWKAHDSVWKIVKDPMAVTIIRFVWHNKSVGLGRSWSRDGSMVIAKVALDR